MAAAIAGRRRALLTGTGLALAGPVLSILLVGGVARLIGAAGVDLPVLAGVVLALVLIQYVAFGGVALLYLRYRGLGPDWVGLGVPTAREGLVTLGGYLLALALALAGTVLATLLGVQGASNNAAELGARVPSVLLVLIPASFLVIAPGEELLFRGVVQRRLREAFEPGVAVPVAAGLFAAIHFVALTGPTLARLSTVLLLFPPALVFGAAYEYTDNLLVPVGIHGLYNATLFTGLYIVVTRGPGLGGEVAALW